MFVTNSPPASNVAYVFSTSISSVSVFKTFNLFFFVTYIINLSLTQRNQHDAHGQSGNNVRSKKFPFVISYRCDDVQILYAFAWGRRNEFPPRDTECRFRFQGDAVPARGGEGRGGEE